MSDLLFPFLRDMVPVVLALYALWRCAGALVRRTTRRERAVMMLGCVCSIMLIVAQLSWWAAKWDGRAEDDWASDYVWLAFNTLTMLAFSLVARRS